MSLCGSDDDHSVNFAFGKINRRHNHKKISADNFVILHTYSR